MIKIACNHCDNTAVSTNESIKIDGQVYCENCFTKHFPEKKDLEGKTIEKNFDPTICSSCHEDFNSLILGKISTYPICSECETKIKNRTFPLWVKAFLGAVAALTIFAFFWNWSYYQAYRNIENSFLYFKKGDFTNAAGLMESASKKVPEMEDLKAMTAFYKGINFLSKDKNEEALTEFSACKNTLSHEINIEPYILEATIGSCFNKKDYDGFLVASKQHLALDTTSATSWTSVASAYACLYAVRGGDSSKAEAYKFLDRAKLIDDTSKDMKQYYNRVEYRIDSREIIDSDVFDKKFPNGWTKN